jgi:hypothetical protein
VATPRNNWLLTAGALSAAAALLHLAVVPGGPDWYRFFGAGEGMARAAERGSPVPALVTVGIAAGLSLWAAYAWSGAGLIGRLPLLRLGLVLIAAIYLVRGLMLPAAVVLGGKPDAFGWWSSLIVLGYGVVHAVGIWRAWPTLGGWVDLGRRP